MANQDPLSMPTVQAAIEQAGRMATLEASMLAIPRELQHLREEGEARANEILKEVRATNGAVAQAIRDRDADRERIAAVELSAHQALALAADASAAVAVLESEREQDGLARREQQIVVKTRWDLVKAQLRFVSLAIGLLGGLGGRQLIDLILSLV